MAEVALDAFAQGEGFADIDDLAAFVAEEVAAGFVGQGAEFVLEGHGVWRRCAVGENSGLAGEVKGEVISKR